MRAVPLSSASKPGGRPRASRHKHNAFSTWCATSGLTADQIAAKLKIGTTSVYHLRSSDFSPGRELAIAIAEMTGDAVPVESWPAKKSKRAPARKG